jgi:hypothetical protein
MWILKFNVIQPSQNFRGMSYADWVAIWCNWLFSEDPDTYDGGDTLFLRGNLNYSSVDTDQKGPRFIDPGGIFDRTGKYGQTIFEGTSIMIPVLVAMFIMGELYEGKRIKTADQLRRNANYEIDKSGPMWATILRKGDKTAFRFVDDLKKYRIATPIFKLIVPRKSRLRNKSDTRYLIGEHDMVAVGYFLLISSLPPNLYRINFGGRTGPYYTNAVYDIAIQGKRNINIEDVYGTRKYLRGKVFRSSFTQNSSNIESGIAK